MDIFLFMGALVLGFLAGRRSAHSLYKHAIQTYFLRQGMNWDAVDRETGEVLSFRLGFLGRREKRGNDRRTRTQWEAYKAQNPNWRGKG